MCLNCGCGMYEDEMGDKDNIVLMDVAKAAKASKMSAKETLEEMKKSLENIKVEDLEKDIEKLPV